MSALPGLDIDRDAVISDDGRYRYMLRRCWDPAVWSLPFVMLNPSTADAEQDDPTIRRCIGFARREGYGGIVVVNLFAYRATDPRDLWDAAAAGIGIEGPDNRYWHRLILGAAADNGVPVVGAWGAIGRHVADSVLDVRELAGAQLRCLGRTKNGQPRHPLYVRGDQPLEPWSAT
jgi:hypothetical protein